MKNRKTFIKWAGGKENEVPFPLYNSKDIISKDDNYIKIEY